MADAATGTAHVVDTAPLHVAGPLVPVGGSPRYLAPSPDGGRLYVTDPATDSVKVIDTATGTEARAPIPVGASPAGLAISPEGRNLLVTVPARKALVLVGRVLAGALTTWKRTPTGQSVPRGRRMTSGKRRTGPFVPGRLSSARPLPEW
ncbi:hypothetical protein [Streptomyces sp. NPDC006446]|uniref:YncE family protein n=1 Tax=Streptomyces sp. NPDC006446 TaxID=3154301 RepID=UPI00339F20BA